MNKKIKAISVVALAGSVLTISMMNPKVSKADEDTRYVGESYITGYSNVTSFVLKSADDALTLEKIKSYYDVTSNEFKNVNQVGTGEKFIANGTTSTILVYGDVDGNGIIGMRDAREVAKHVADPDNSELSTLQREAGNVYDNGNGNGLTIRDARTIAQYVAGQSKEYIVEKKEAPKPSNTPSGGGSTSKPTTKPTTSPSAEPTAIPSVEPTPTQTPPEEKTKITKVVLTSEKSDNREPENITLEKNSTDIKEIMLYKNETLTLDMKYYDGDKQITGDKIDLTPENVSLEYEDANNILVANQTGLKDAIGTIVKRNEAGIWNSSEEVDGIKINAGDVASGVVQFNITVDDEIYVLKVNVVEKGRPEKIKLNTGAEENPDEISLTLYKNPNEDTIEIEGMYYTILEIEYKDEHKRPVEFNFTNINQRATLEKFEAQRKLMGVYDNTTGTLKDITSVADIKGFYKDENDKYTAGTATTSEKNNITAIGIALKNPSTVTDTSKVFTFAYNSLNADKTAVERKTTTVNITIAE